MRKLLCAVMVLPALSVAGCGGEEGSAPPAQAQPESRGEFSTAAAQEPD